MKNGKRPTKSQRKQLECYGFHAEDWLVSKNTSKEMVIVHRYTDQKRCIPKQLYTIT